ncbi:hypothetical protein K457DRAFT_26191, partial [Linnemannia elongata AG-77]
MGMQAADDDQASRHYSTPSSNRARHSHQRSSRMARRSSGDDTDEELNDVYGEDRSACRPSDSSYRSNNSLGRGGKLDEDAEFCEASPVTPLKMRMDRLARSTPRSQHYQQQDVYYQNERGTHQGEDDAIAQGARRSAKDGSQYMQRTQQEDLTIKSVKGLGVTQKAKQSLRQQGIITTPIRRPPMPCNTSTRNNGSPANYRGEQNQEMGTRQQWQHTGRREEYNLQELSPLTTRALPSLSPNQAALHLQQSAHQQHVLRQQILQLQQYDQQQLRQYDQEQHMQSTPSPFHSSPQQLQQRKRPYTDDHRQSVTPNRPYNHNHIFNPPQSSPYVLPTASVQQQPTASTSHSHPSPTAHNTAQVIIPVQVQSQFQPTATFPPMAAILQRGHLDSMLASIEQPLHLLSSSPSSDHRPIATSATLQKLTREVAANAIPTRKKKTTEDVFETRIANARLAYGGSVGWCRLYRSVPFGMLPTKEQLKTHNPPSAMKLLSDVPIDKSRANSEVGHFFEKQSMNSAHHYAYKYKYHQHSSDDSNSDNNNSDDNNNNNHNHNNDDNDDDK